MGLSWIAWEHSAIPLSGTKIGLLLNPNPHYSRAFLLQSLIRCCDKPLVGGLALAFDVLHEYASGPPGSARRSRHAAPRFRDEPS